MLGILIRSLIASFLGLIFLNAYAYIPSNQSYGPIYPDIWGYDLSQIPAVKWGGAKIEFYGSEDGDIWFIIDNFYEIENPLSKTLIYKNKKYTLIKFFKNERHELSENQKNKIVKVLRNQQISLPTLDSDAVIFSDKSRLSLHYRSSSTSCYIPSFSYGWFNKKFSNHTEKKYVIISPNIQVKMYKDRGLCDLKSASFFYSKISMISNIIPLKDDTFIGFSDDASLIIRLDKDLKTQFKAQSFLNISKKSRIERTFYIIDCSLIEALEDKFLSLPTPLYQSIHDALLNHLYTQNIINRKS